jgi:hypothetical protein
VLIVLENNFSERYLYSGVHAHGKVMLEILRSIVKIQFYETADYGGGLVVFEYWSLFPLKSGF